VRARYGEPDSALESISKAKRARLVRLAQAYLNDNSLDVPHRIDVVAVDLSRATAEIIENAVGW